jgi:hypothetical protein
MSAIVSRGMTAGGIRTGFRRQPSGATIDDTELAEHTTRLDDRQRQFAAAIGADHHLDPAGGNHDQAVTRTTSGEQDLAAAQGPQPRSPGSSPNRNCQDVVKAMCLIWAGLSLDRLQGRQDDGLVPSIQGGIEMAHPDEDLTRAVFAAAVPVVVVKLAETAGEREQVFRLRYETYVTEMNLFTSIVDHSTRRLTDAHDEESTLLIAEADGQPVGTMRMTFGADGPFSAEFLETYSMDAFFPVVPREEMAVVTRFTVREAHRGTAIPFDLVVEGARIAVKRNIELIFCDAQPHLVGQWGMLGFRPYRQSFNDPVAGLAIPQVLLLNDGDYLRQIASPLLGAALDADLPTSEAARRVRSMLPAKPPVRSLKYLKNYDWPSEIAPDLIGQALRVFENLDDTQLAEILSRSHIIDVSPDTYLIRQGQTTRTMYVLLGGELQYRAGERHLPNAQVGEVVGDVAFFLKTPRAIDVITGSGGARVLSLSEGALQDVMQSHSQAAAILLLNICRMLAARVADQTEGI